MVDDADYAWLMQWKWYANKIFETFYAMRTCKSQRTQATLLMHRVILGLTDPLIETDHRDGNGLNNQHSNLRVATRSQNNRNRGVQKNNTSGIRGVDWNNGKWRAYIYVNGKQVYLGLFAELEDAKQARLVAELQYHGAFSATLSRKKPAQSVAGFAEAA